MYEIVFSRIGMQKECRMPPIDDDATAFALATSIALAYPDASVEVAHRGIRYPVR